MSIDIETARAICGSLIPGIEEISRQYEAALTGLEYVADRTREDAEQLLQEARALAAASTMTTEAAIWRVAVQKQQEHAKRERERLQAGGVADRNSGGGGPRGKE